MGLLADVIAEAKTYRTPPVGRQGEIALADARRLFPTAEGWYTPYNPSLLVGRKGMQVFDKMLLDDQVKAALNFKKHAVVYTGWTVTSPEGYPEDWEVTRFVDDQLRELRGTFQDDLLEILSGLAYGYSVTEKVYNQLPDGRIGLGALKTRKPHDFLFRTDEFGNLLPDGVIQIQPTGHKKLPADKFVIYVHDFEFSNWYGRSDLEAAYRPWWAKDNAYKWLVILLERLGIPPVIAMYDPGRYSPELTDKLKDAMKNLQAATFGVFPRPGGADALEMWAPEAAGQATRVFTPSLDMFNRDIARALLMPAQLGVTADVQEGSFARAQVNFDMFMLVVQNLRVMIEETVVFDQIVRPLVDLNYAVTEYPIWKFKPMTEETRLDLLTTWLQAVQGGVVVTQPADESHIRDLLKFPERTEEPAVFTFSRQPNAFERRVDFARIERDLDRLEAGALTRLREILTDSRDQLLAFVGRRLDGRQAIVDDVKIMGMPDLQLALRDLLTDAFKQGSAALRREVPRTFQQGPDFTPTEALRWLSRQSIQVSGIVGDRLLQDVKQILLNALKFGEPQRETIEKLRRLFEPYLGDPTVIRDDEAVEPYRLETLLRTRATEAFNQGRLVTSRDPDIARFMRGMQYSAVIDSRTTPVCRFLDGKVFRMGEPEMDRLAPPNHYNCRSLLVPVVIGQEIAEERFITPRELGRAEELAGEGFK